MSKTATPAKKRDAALEKLSKLSAMMESPSAPGQEQAARVLKANDSNTVPDETKPKARPTVSKPKEKQKQRKSSSMGEGKAQNMGLSLHPADQDRIYEIEGAVRKAGIRGRPSTSLLIKLAVAAFDASKVENLAELYRQLEAQDGRRRKV